MPDNELSWFARVDYFKTDKKYDDATIEKTLRKHRMWLTYWFEYPIPDLTIDMGLEEDEGPTLRSASQKIDNWVVDQDLAEGQHTNQRKLDRYPIE